MTTGQAMREAMEATGVKSQRLTAEQAKTMAQGVVFLDLKICGTGFRVVDRQVDESLFETPEQAREMHLSKDLLQRKDIAPIRRAANRWKTWVGFRSLSSKSLSRGGVYLIPVGLIGDVDARVQQLINETAEETENLIANYDTLKAAQRDRLGSRYDESDYPTVEQVRQAYRIEPQWVTMVIPDQLQAVSAELYAREQERVGQQWQDAFADIREALRTSFLGFVQKFSAALVPEINGRKKGLSSASFNSLNAFFATFDARNLAGDEDLARLVAEARALLASEDAKTLKGIDARVAVKRELDAIAGNLASLVRPTGVHRVNFEDGL